MKSKPTCWLVKVDDSYIGETVGKSMVTFPTPPWPWQLKKFRRMGEKTLEKISRKYGAKRIKAVAVFDGDVVKSATFKIEILRADSGTLSFL